MPDLKDYDELADQWAYIASLIEQATRNADMLMVPIPQSLARCNADILTYPAQIREVGARRAGTWVETTRHDEPEEGS